MIANCKCPLLLGLLLCLCCHSTHTILKGDCAYNGKTIHDTPNSLLQHLQPTYSTGLEYLTYGRVFGSRTAWGLFPGRSEDYSVQLCLCLALEITSMGTVHCSVVIDFAKGSGGVIVMYCMSLQSLWPMTSLHCSM